MEVSSSGSSDSKISYTNDDVSQKSDELSSSERSDEYSDKCDVEKLNDNEALKKRINSLKESMISLSKQLKEEKAMWKQEVEEVIKKKSENTISDSDSDNKISEYDNFSILGYEQKLIKYQEALQRAEIDKKLSLQRQIAISNYKRRLLEVENMCNLELLRVKQNVQFLQPLQMMLSDWNTNIMPQFSNEKDTIEVTQNAVNIPLEIINNKLQPEAGDVIKYSSKAYSNASMPQLTATAALWQSDDNYTTHSQSTIWYAECQTKFNAF